MALEERYIPIKLKDVQAYLGGADKTTLERILGVLSSGREKDGRGELKCLVIEKDWPEYEKAMEMLENRLNGDPGLKPFVCPACGGRVAQLSSYIGSSEIIGIGPDGLPVYSGETHIDWDSEGSPNRDDYFECGICLKTFTAEQLGIRFEPNRECSREFWSSLTRPQKNGELEVMCNSSLSMMTQSHKGEFMDSLDAARELALIMVGNDSALANTFTQWLWEVSPYPELASAEDVCEALYLAIGKAELPKNKGRFLSWYPADHMRAVLPLDSGREFGAKLLVEVSGGYAVIHLTGYSDGVVRGFGLSDDNRGVSLEVPLYGVKRFAVLEFGWS